MPEHTFSLDLIQIANPCPEPWDNMRGDDRTRFCDRCQLSVYNLAGMTRPEAEALVGNREGRLCVRFYRRQDGTVLTADCTPIRLAKLRKRVRGGLVAAGVAVLMGLNMVGLVHAEEGASATPATAAHQSFWAERLMSFHPVRWMLDVVFPPQPPPKQPIYGEEVMGRQMMGDMMDVQ